MTRKAWLDGDDFDLETLAEQLTSGDSKVVREGDNYYLTSPEIDAAPDDLQANNVAAKIIGRINALGRMNDPSFRPLKLSRYTDDAGRNVVVGVIAATIGTARMRATATVTRPDGTVVPNPPSPWPDYLVLANNDSAVAEVLQIMSRAEPLGWVELYKVHEIIRDSIKPQKIPDLGWADKGTDSGFTASANLPGVSGSDARHARLEGAPQRTMKIGEGRAYISQLVTKWLDSLAPT